MSWNIPNKLTVYRLLAAPGLFAVYEVFPRPWADWAALVLFTSAALTDYLDGYLARRWQQVSAFGRMLDPIADKAMTIVALVMLLVLFLQDGRSVHWPIVQPVLIGSWLLVAPVLLIIFREVFISGLREFLGAEANTLAVTRLAKWKTAVQMTAIAVLFSMMLFEHYFATVAFAMEQEFLQEVLAGNAEDKFRLVLKRAGWIYSYNTGIALLWLAAALTVITGFSYYLQALPLLREKNQ